MKLLGALIAVLVLGAQSEAAINKMAPMKFKGQKATTFQGKQISSNQMFNILKSQKGKLSKPPTQDDWEGLYTFKVTTDEGSGLIRVPVLSSASFPGSFAKEWPNYLLAMPVGAVAESYNLATSLIPYVVTKGKDHDGSDIYVGLEDFGFFYYRFAVKADRTGSIYLVESLSGEPRETEVAKLELTAFETKASLNLEVSTYDYEIKTEEAKKLTSKSDACGTNFKGEFGFVKFPGAIATYPAGYAWQNLATDGGKCSLLFGGSPVGPRADTLKVENPGYLGCQTQEDDEGQLALCMIGLASELQFQGVPASTNLIMKLYLTRVYQYEVAASVNLIKR